MEHLNNPGLFLKEVRKVLNKDGELVITVPNSFSFKKFVGVSVFKQERNHPDHVCYYSLMNLHQLLGRYGFTIVETNSFLIVDTNQRKANVIGYVANLAMKIFSNNNIGDEWAIVAKPEITT